MFCLEELTQEELISWIRENVQVLDEGNIVRDAFIRRRDLIWEARDKWFKRYTEVGIEINQLIEKYVDGPVKPGMKLRNWPIEARKEYERLDGLRKEVWMNYQVCSRKDHEINDKIIGFTEEQTERINQIMLEKREKQNNGTEN